MQTRAGPKDNGTPSKQTIESTALEIQHDRGVIYVYGRDGSPLLNVTGLPRPIPDCDSPAGRQLTIDIVTAGVSCGWTPHVGAVERSYGPVPGGARRDRESILKQAGATIVGSASVRE